MIDDPLFWLLALVAVTALGFSKGGFGGAGMIATPLMSLFMPPLQAAAMLLPIQIIQDAIGCWIFRRTYNGWILKVMLPGAVIGVGLAWLLAAHVSDAFIRLMLGVVSILFVLHTWFAPAPPPSTARPSPVAGAFWGSSAAFTSAICQAGTPPFQMFVLPQNLDKMTYAGTFVMFFSVINVMKLAPYIALGQFTVPNFTMTLMMIPVAIGANYLGVWLVKRTPTILFFRIAHILIFLISLELIRAGFVGMMGW